VIFCCGCKPQQKIMQFQDLWKKRLLVVIVDNGIAQSHFYLFIDLAAHTLKDLLPADLIPLQRTVQP
jgi:hypothetical protein